MQLLLAIVQSEDADTLCGRLNAAGFELTRLHSVGGFLSRGNVTILLGLEAAQIPAVLEIIRKTCRTRRRYINPAVTGTEPAHMTLVAPAIPLEVQVGGATIFNFPVLRFERLHAQPGAPTPTAPSSTLSQGARKMNLVLAIVHNDDADAVTRALLAAGRRVTRINTAGGFLRRGNVTLLVGIEPAEVDAVLETIREHCRPRTEAGGHAGEIATAGATAFVLEANSFLHM